jgi:hypothetical protein
MRNKVELLRSIEYTKEDLKNIQNLEDIDTFTDKDIEFMEEFKKIYEFGLNQLELFINKLIDEGKDLDVYSINYYMDVLLNGPLGSYVRTLSKDKTYFKNHPDSLGILGNKLKTIQNTTILIGYDDELGCPVDVYNKLPLTLQNNLKNAVKNVESVFKSCFSSSTIVDNTLPLVDKKPQERYFEESKGTWVFSAHGNYGVRDSYFYKVIDDISESIFEKIKNYLGEETFRLYRDAKEYNPFDDKNDSTSKNWKVKREEGTSDLMGNTFDSDDKRKASLKVSTNGSDKEYQLNTVVGQLGI